MAVTSNSSVDLIFVVISIQNINTQVDGVCAPPVQAAVLYFSTTHATIPPLFHERRPYTTDGPDNVCSSLPRRPTTSFLFWEQLIWDS